MDTKRVWLLGAFDPEMDAIGWILHDCGETVVHARTDDGWHVRPSEAYKQSEVTGAEVAGIIRGAPHVVVYCVECAPPRINRVGEFRSIDHHKPGDVGYGRPPKEFWEASSLGQVVEELARLGVLPEGWTERDQGLLLIAAADHCLGAAYLGDCPGVDPVKLGEFRARERARFQSRFEPGITAETILRRIRETQAAIREAPSLILLERWCDKHASIGRDGDDCGGSDGDYPHEGEDYCETVAVRDMRAATPWPELPEAATRMGVGYVSGPLVDPDGKEKYTCSGTEEQVLAFMNSWGPQNGLVNIYGDPARGFAGGYEK